METITIDAYSIHELSQDAAEYAIEQEREARSECNWVYDAYVSLRKFCEWFNVEVREHPHSWTGEVWLQNYDLESWLESNNLHGLQGERLRRWIDARYGSVLREPKVYGDKYGKGAKRTSRITTRETDCPFTGDCVDEELLAPIRKYIAKGLPKHYTYVDVMDECISAFNRAITSEYEYWLSDEAIIEDFEANDALFTENGRRTYSL